MIMQIRSICVTYRWEYTTEEQLGPYGKFSFSFSLPCNSKFPLYISKYPLNYVIFDFCLNLYTIISQNIDLVALNLYLNISKYLFSIELTELKQTWEIGTFSMKRRRYVGKR